jgi:hypothetical protein
MSSRWAAYAFVEYSGDEEEVKWTGKPGIGETSSCYAQYGLAPSGQGKSSSAHALREALAADKVGILLVVRFTWL